MIQRVDANNRHGRKAIGKLGRHLASCEDKRRCTILHQEHLSRRRKVLFDG